MYSFINIYKPLDAVFPRRFLLFYKTKRANHYQFGFNGQLKDNEIYGEGNAYTAEFWEYDPRSIRRWNRDPKAPTSISSYLCFGNNPLFFVDPSGAIIEPSSKVSKEHIKVVYKYINTVTNKSKILSMIYQNLESATAKYTIGAPSFGDKDGGSFSPNNKSPIVAMFSKTDYRGVIRVNYKNLAKLDESWSYATAAEELFHAGQDLFRRRNKSQFDSDKSYNLQDEVEVRVFRAFSGFIGKGETYLEDFEASPEVSKYFDALRNNDIIKTKKLEEGFRKAVIDLADNITNPYTGSGGYSKLRGEYDSYAKEGGATPLFDTLTKDAKLKD